MYIPLTSIGVFGEVTALHLQ